MVRVLIVDDSPTVRAVLRRLLAPHPDVQVTGEATNGQEAVDLVLKLRPDVVVMDVEMPVMDGLDAIGRIMKLRPTPILVLTSRANRDRLAVAFEAVRRGALEVLPKPEAPEGWEELAQRLPELVRTASGLPAHRPVLKSPPRLPRVAPRVVEWILLGASTGGPGALRAVLAAFPPALQVPIAVVQHIASGFEEGLAHWLARDTGRDVGVARSNERLRAGAVRLAPANAHLRLAADGTLQVDTETPPRQGHRPSVDVLFESALSLRPTHVVAVLFSGMGSDGAFGLLQLKRAGAVTAVQDEATSAVFGMPKQALELGASEVALPPEELARFVARACGEEG
ncbi:MAG: chemotaxis-specific protein-glutamate methyltransferase CheB [Thermoanaerobaculum sp.]